MIQLNGNMLFRMKNFIMKEYGQEVYNQLVETVPQDSKKVLSGIIISGNWYDAKIYSDLLQSVADKKGKDELVRLSIELGKQQLTGLFGFISKIIPPETLIKRSQVMWKTLHSQGNIEIAEYSDEKILIKVHDFYFTDIHLLSATGYFKGLIDKVLNKDVKYEYRNPSEGEYEFEFNLS